MRAKRDRQAASASPRFMGTRFRPADPEAVRRRFEAIRARALERADDERRAILAKLASEPIQPRQPMVASRRRGDRGWPERSGESLTV